MPAWDLKNGHLSGRLTGEMSVFTSFSYTGSGEPASFVLTVLMILSDGFTFFSLTGSPAGPTLPRLQQSFR